jgi:hypothetical protein
MLLAVFVSTASWKAVPAWVHRGDTLDVASMLGVDRGALCESHMSKRMLVST